MSTNNSNWPEIYSVGIECIERYVHSREVDSPIEDHDVIASGLSDLKGSYDIARADFIGHVVSFTLDGVGLLSTPDFKHVLTKGDIMVIPVGYLARYQIHGPTWKTLWFDLANTERWSWLLSQGIRVSKANHLDFLESAMESLYFEIHHQELEARLLAKHIIEQIMIYLRRELEFKVIDYENNIKHRLNKLFESVNKQLQVDWSVAKLASQSAVSESHLYALCRRYLGVNPMKHVAHLRMKRAKLLLYQTNAPVGNISLTVGYQNQFNFSSAFKKHTGESPSDFRKRTRNSALI
jgi:AraC-like DNA-binding protein